MIQLLRDLKKWVQLYTINKALRVRIFILERKAARIDRRAARVRQAHLDWARDELKRYGIESTIGGDRDE